MSCSIGFSAPKKFKIGAECIKLFMGTSYSHTYLKFNRNGKTLVYHATSRGVVLVSYEEFCKYNKVIDEIETTNCEAAEKFCQQYLGKPYSYISLLAVLFNIKLGDGKKSFICSELVVRAFDLPFKHSDITTPEQIRDYLKVRNG